MTKRPAKQTNRYSRSLQRGSVLIIALFVMVVVVMLGAALLKMQRTSSEAIAQEVLGTRALAAARSGMEIQLQKLFAVGGPGVCPTVTVTYNQLANLDGLKNCQAQVSCQNYANDNGIAYYRLTSTGACGSGDIDNSDNTVVISSRTLQVEARSL